MITKSKFIESGKKTGNSFWRLLPVLIGVLLIASLVIELIPKLVHMGFLGHGPFLDMLSADFIGSLSTGQPVVSYLLAGELQKSGIDLYTVTAFIIAWVSVGVISLPAEAVMLGWRFSIWRNIVAFFMAMVLAWLTVQTLTLLTALVT